MIMPGRWRTITAGHDLRPTSGTPQVRAGSGPARDRYTSRAATGSVDRPGAARRPETGGGAPNAVGATGGPVTPTPVLPPTRVRRRRPRRTHLVFGCMDLSPAEYPDLPDRRRHHRHLHRDIPRRARGHLHRNHRLRPARVESPAHRRRHRPGAGHRHLTAGAVSTADRPVRCHPRAGVRAGDRRLSTRHLRCELRHFARKPLRTLGGHSRQYRGESTTWAAGHRPGTAPGSTAPHTTRPPPPIGSGDDTACTDCPQAETSLAPRDERARGALGAGARASAGLRAPMPTGHAALRHRSAP